MWTRQRQHAHLLRCLDSAFCVVVSQKLSFTSGVLSQPFKFGTERVLQDDVYRYCSRNLFLSLQRREAHNQVSDLDVKSGNGIQRLSELADTVRPFALGDNISWNSRSFEEQEEIQMYFLKLLSYGINSIDPAESTGFLETLTALSDANITWKEVFPPLRKTILKILEKKAVSLNMLDLCVLLEGYDKFIISFFSFSFLSSIPQIREAWVEMGEVANKYYECINGSPHHSSSRTALS
jgi:hypothetical protein